MGASTSAFYATPDSPVYVRVAEGRFWKPGRVHKASRVRLKAVVGGPHAATQAVTKCGEQIAYPKLETTEPARGARCGRCFR
jgi:hypothetical protein